METDPVFCIQPFLYGVKGRPGLTCLKTYACHDAEALGLDVDLPFLAFMGPDLMAVCVIGSYKPLSVPAFLKDGFFHGLLFLPDGFRLFLHAFQIAQIRILSRIFHEHAADEDGFGHRTFGRAGGLERLSRVLREAVEVETVVPVGPADQRKRMGTLMAHGKADRSPQMFHQGL